VTETLRDLLDHADYFLAGALLVLGLHGILARSNLVRKLIAMSVLQVAVIVFFISLASRTGAAPPIAVEGFLPPAGGYVNPLPHALMLTAIVVSVSTTGVALALLVRLHQRFGTVDEDELLEKLRE
jgi:multicomponent Na+:H+ antiporter subunit C